MRAWSVGATGDPAQVLERAEVERPEPGKGEVLVRVRAAALNFPDALMIRGGYQERPPLPFTPGIELCGDVVAAGPGTQAVVGERVMGASVLPHGGLAEYAIAAADMLFPAPARFDDAQAAAFTVAYQTGWFALHRRAALRSGETLLVHAAAGGVGSAAVQLGKAAGARVVGVVGGAAKAAAARESGADAVVDRTLYPEQRAFAQALKDACGPGGADVVYDPVGGAAFAASTKAVAFEGRIVVVGFAGGEIAQAATNHALVKNYAVLGLHWGLYRSRAPELIRDAARDLAESVQSGALTPVVSRRLEFDQAAEGLTELAAGRSTGRLVVDVAG
ncbi:NADPH2:quinone reductase [Murinocardiopsis flavida]|uniref:NADPH2:quinone reductase n=1 Tax=Murinocardiopsis flavida TaxID=645275 RepID=A0A2P8DLM2_9ACTN|nr:NADPH:quinone oxidoreductase family protein [Murinocardiopsis flavida]PSK98133.1 NADPH2:quinone reductase [Murinocardiopsis flavida]